MTKFQIPALTTAGKAMGKQTSVIFANKHEILISPAGEREREKIKILKKIKKKKKFKIPNYQKALGKFFKKIKK